MVVNVDTAVGSGSPSSWDISLAGAVGATGAAGTAGVNASAEGAGYIAHFFVPDGANPRE